MNSPYMGKFQVTQEFKGQAHDGLDPAHTHEKFSFPKPTVIVTNL